MITVRVIRMRWWCDKDEGVIRVMCDNSEVV